MPPPLVLIYNSQWFIPTHTQKSIVIYDYRLALMKLDCQHYYSEKVIQGIVWIIWIFVSDKPPDSSGPDIFRYDFRKERFQRSDS